MAAVSQKATPAEVLPELAHNVVVHGYEGPPDGVHRPTEYLILLKRYIDQARELSALAGASGVIRVKDCSEAGPLLGILGYRLPQGCGNSHAVETADRERAFVTIDSGFPLPALEEALHGGKPFEYAFTATRVPVVLNEADWKAIANYERKGANDDVLDVLVRDPQTARLYWALAQMDAETRAQLRQAPGLNRLAQHAAELDFYGSHLSIRAGRVRVPGGAAAEAGWNALVGADPGSPADFVMKLVSKDNGWLAAYFDGLWRATQAQQAYYTHGDRLKLFYGALHRKETSSSATRSVLRPDGGLLLLLTQLRLEANGEPSVPGNLEVWRQILRHSGDAGAVKDLVAKSDGWKSADKLVQAMFALSRLNMPRGAEQTYLVLGEMDRRRAGGQRLTAETVRLLADKFHVYGDQYAVFCEFYELNNDAIARFIATAEGVDHIRNPQLRFNTVGLLQANMGLWEILARQGEIPKQALNESFERVLSPFAGIHSLPQLYDATRTSLNALVSATGNKADLRQDEILALLAGPRQAGAEGQRVRQELAERMRSVLVRQRLVSLDSLFALGEGLKDLAEGRTKVENLMPLAAELREFEMPRTLFTNTERTEYAIGIPENRNSSVQVRSDLTKVLKAQASPSSVVNARGQLVPFLRDTLVGLNYAYYEPPGAQMLHNNPLFVRSHDFGGTMGEPQQGWQTPQLLGAGIAAGRGAHLVGSLADLPYVLAQVEQDFIVPENVQALIWDELAPTLMTSAVLPRWWHVSRNELHAVALYQKSGEEILTAAAGDEKLRQETMEIFADRMTPQREELIERGLRGGRTEEVLPLMLPADTFYLAAEFRRRHSRGDEATGAAGKELQDLAGKFPDETSWERISADFGVPHPAMERNYSLELTTGKILPSLAGYGSRLLAESWDSNNLYWARLADEMGYAPAALNEVVPHATLRMVEKIFASNLDDWPALLRAMHEAGEELKQGKNTVATHSESGQGMAADSTPR